MATHKISYGAITAVTLTFASLATSSTFVAGREGVFIDNTSNLYDDIMVSVKVTTGTTPTANTQILLFAFGELDDAPTWPDVMAGADANKTITSVGVGQGFLRLVAALNVDSNTSNRAYYAGGISIASLFGGTMPKRVGLWCVHNTAVALNATGGNHVLNYYGVNYTIV